LNVAVKSRAILNLAIPSAIPNRVRHHRPGVVMTTTPYTLWTRRLAVILLCALLSKSLGAQAGAQNDANRAGAKAFPPAATDPSAAKPHDDSFVIGNDDVLAINVWKEPDISRSIPVRSDGKISLPLVGEVQAAGQTPLKLEQDIASKLKNYISEPEVTVMVQQINSQKFNILGQVVRPGTYVIANSVTVLDAIALAGGFRDFAKQKSIYILRQSSDGGQTRIPFNYKDVVNGKNTSQNIRLQPRDTIVVP
jgi:polysaccharide biosynthesis/export protein